MTILLETCLTRHLDVTFNIFMYTFISSYLTNKAAHVISHTSNISQQAEWEPEEGDKM